MKTLLDFQDGNGPTPARQHPNGGGWVAETAHVDLSARVSGDAWVYGDAQVYGTALVSGAALVSGDARVYGTAQVSGDARVYGTARVCWDAQVCWDAWDRSPLQIRGTRDQLTTSSFTTLTIGCQTHSVEHWLENFQQIGREFRYTPDQVEEYGFLIRVAAEWLKRQNLGGDK